MNNPCLELKNDFYDALIEVELHDVNDNEFEIKINSNNKYLFFNLWIEKLNILKYNIQSLVPQSLFETNEVIRVLTKINESNLKGWVKGVIQQIKGEFYLVALSMSNNLAENKKIFHKSELRNSDE